MGGASGSTGGRRSDVVGRIVATNTAGASRMTFTISSIDRPVMVLPWMSRIWSPGKPRYQ